MKRIPLHCQRKCIMCKLGLCEVSSSPAMYLPANAVLWRQHPVVVHLTLVLLIGAVEPLVGKGFLVCRTHRLSGGVEHRVHVAIVVVFMLDRCLVVHPVVGSAVFAVSLAVPERSLRATTPTLPIERLELLAHRACAGLLVVKVC